MPDLDKLRSLGEQIVPPPLALLEETARRRDRRTFGTFVGVGLAAALVVVGGIAVVQTAGDDRSLPDPVTPVSPTPTPQVTPTPSPDAEPTHQSETSMTPQEVALAANAELAYAGVSADDPDFRLAVWTAECTWCPKANEESETRPGFKAIAVTTDGWRTATYRRPPRGAAGIFYVHSPARGILLVVDPANGGEWLVREDGTWLLLPHAAEERPATSSRGWFQCKSAEDRVTWCAFDAVDDTVYAWGDAWSGGPGDDISAVNPRAGVEPWGRGLMSADGPGPLTAWWYQDGVRRTRTLVEDLPSNSRAGSVLGADEGDLLYWSLARGDDVMRFFVGDDLGQSWRLIEQSYPATRSGASVDVLATPEGTLVLREVSESGDGSRTRLWRLDSLEEGEWTLVHDVQMTQGWTDNALQYPFSVFGSRLVMGALSSDDDGRTWTAVDRWR